ncbi:TonB-dependent receptor [Pontibacter harenae]|uniref:TonB-dependent receptor n=1 Tax=Pontibacter harenae TaxID=2894083 RepID=UPI001E40C6A5|nr:TonB-dependent receptor [Pontibacter harenae]
MFAQDAPEAPAEEAKQDCGLTLSGKVIDHETREPLVGATIFIEKLNRATVTDEYGNYHFHHLCQGNYALHITYVGYAEESLDLRMTSSTVRDMPLHLTAKQLGAVQIVGSHITEQSQAVSTLQGRELEETRGLSLGESLKRLTGVSSMQTGPGISKPVIHGLHSSRILILNNGVRHEAQQWGEEHAPEIDQLNAQEVKVIKGAAGVRYGSDAIGGIVVVNPKPLPDSAGTAGEVHLVGSTNNRMGTASAMIESKLRQLPLSWRLQSSVKKAGNARTPNYYLDNTGFEEHNISAAIAYKKERFGSELYYSRYASKTGVLSAAHVGNKADFDNAMARGIPLNAEDATFSYDINRPYQAVTHQLLKARAYYKTGEAGELQFTYALQQNIRDEYDKHGPRNNERALLGLPELHLDLQTHTTDLVWEHQPIGRFKGSFGATTIWQNNTTQGRYFIPFYKNFTAGVFGEERWRKNNLQLEAGFRYDHKDLDISKWEQQGVFRTSYSFNNLSGSVGALYDLGYHFILSGNVSYASRAPHPNELFANGMHHGTGTYELGDPNLQSENAINTVATVNYHSNLRLNGELSLYHNAINNYIYRQVDPLQPVVVTVRGTLINEAYTQTNARFWGADLNLEYNLTDALTIEFKTTIVRAKNETTNGYLPNIPADRTDNSIRYSFNDAGRLANSYFSVGGLLVAEQHRANVATEPLQLPPDGYFLLHAEAGTRIMFGNQPVDIGITGSNLLNTAYRDYQNRLRYYAEEVGRMLLFRVKVPLNFI